VKQSNSKLILTLITAIILLVLVAYFYSNSLDLNNENKRLIEQNVRLNKEVKSLYLKLDSTNIVRNKSLKRIDSLNTQTTIAMQRLARKYEKLKDVNSYNVSKDSLYKLIYARINSDTTFNNH
jgi:predicted RND superfamily exporter protein